MIAEQGRHGHEHIAQKLVQEAQSLVDARRVTDVLRQLFSEIVLRLLWSFKDILLHHSEYENRGPAKLCVKVLRKIHCESNGF